MKAAMFNVADQTGILFREALKKANDTRDIEDYVAELGNLELMANNLISESMETGNLEHLLLAGLAINDPTLSFEKKASEGFIRLTFDDPEVEAIPFENYADSIMSQLNLECGDVICWLFEYSEKVAASFIDYQGNHSIIDLKSWDIDLMKSWLSQELNAFVFNEVKASINEQEQDYIKALEDLGFSIINIPFECSRLFVYTSIDLAAFPKNLILFDTPLTDERYHRKREIVKNYTVHAKRDLVSYYKPVTDIIFIERFARHGKYKEIKLNELTVESWIPIDDEDMALYIAYTRMRGPLSDYQCEIRSDLIPRPPLNGLINFVAAHGEKTGEGFKAVHTKEGEGGHAITNGIGTEYIFGNGLIAVVFICNSGYQSKRIYSQALTSFVNQLIKLGYESVVAPAWKYNPEMCGMDRSISPWDKIWNEIKFCGLSCELYGLRKRL